MREISRRAVKKWMAKPENKAKHIAWTKANPEKRRAYARKWIAANRWLTCLYSQNRRAREQLVAHTLTLAEWRAILDYFGHACAYCLRGNVKLTIEHVVPIIEGGPHSAENVVPACASCNSTKGRRSILTMLNRAA
jgi:5-methylcytosine-specific restriction endonuclease McrA